MFAKTADRIANFEKSVAEMEELTTYLGPLISRYLLLHKNIRLSTGPWDEPITLNLRIDEWPKQHKYCQESFGHRILGMDIRWI